MLTARTGTPARLRQADAQLDAPMSAATKTRRSAPTREVVEGSSRRGDRGEIRLVYEELRGASREGRDIDVGWGWSRLEVGSSPRLVSNDLMAVAADSGSACVRGNGSCND
jgi:hypothetical protein